jgi:hypothetical protein
MGTGVALPEKAPSNLMPENIYLKLYRVNPR